MTPIPDAPDRVIGNGVAMVPTARESCGVLRWVGNSRSQPRNPLVELVGLSTGLAGEEQGAHGGANEILLHAFSIGDPP